MGKCLILVGVICCNNSVGCSSMLRKLRRSMEPKGKRERERDTEKTIVLLGLRPDTLTPRLTPDPTLGAWPDRVWVEPCRLPDMLDGLAYKNRPLIQGNSTPNLQASQQLPQMKRRSDISMARAVVLAFL